jgi:hypothetical protein
VKRDGDGWSEGEWAGRVKRDGDGWSERTQEGHIF